MWTPLLQTAFAQEETSVLPHGVFRTWVIGAVGGTQYKFNPSGKKEGLAHSLNRSISMVDIEKALASSKNEDYQRLAEEFNVLRNALNAFGESTDRPGYGDNLFQSDYYADAHVNLSQLVLALEYGLTPKLSVGLAAPLMWYDIRANVRLKNQDNYATVLHDTKGFNIEKLVQKFSKSAPDINTYNNNIFVANGYYVPKDTQLFGVADLEGGFKYRAFESTYIDSSVLFGFRLPTGTHKKDFRNLVDQNIGDGQLDLAFQASVDFKINPNLVFLSSAKYTFQTPDREYVVGPQIGSTGLLPDLTDPNSYDYAQRKLGDIIDLNFNLRYYMFQRRFTVIGAYLFQFKNEDRYEGDNRLLDYSYISQNTQGYSHAGELFLIYSTVSDFMRKEKQIPWEASLTYHHTFSGKNTPDLSYAYARLKFFFN